VLYVSEGADRAVSFTYLVNNRYATGSHGPVRMKGLDPAKRYRIRELNVYPGTTSPFRDDATYSGDYLMHVGFNPVVNARRTSVVLELTEAR
jgi:alpha-galactosidase